MPLLERLDVLLAKIESSYGVDPTPTGAANAILVGNLGLRPVVTEFQPRELVLPYLGNFESLPADFALETTFDAELIGAATAGTAPPIGPLLRACGLAEKLLGTAHAGTATAGTASTITLAAGASASDDAYNGLLIRLTGGTGSGQQRVITDYVGSTKVATIGENWGTNPTGTTTYSIDAQASYTKVSSGFESVHLYHVIGNSVRHRGAGARGNLECIFDNKGRPIGRFRMQALYNTPTDNAVTGADYSSFQTPVLVGNDYTTPFRIHGLETAIASSVMANLNNELTFRSLIGGSKTVQITNSPVTGECMIEAVTVATKDFWTLIRNATLGAMHMTHGSAAGKKVTLNGHRTQLLEPSYEVQDGIRMLRLPQNWVPTFNQGNDEFHLIFH